MMSNSNSRSRGLEAGPRDPLDRGVEDADQLDVRLVVDLVVVGLLRNAAGAEAVVLRDQHLRDLRVLHPLADLARHEVREQRVRRSVDQHVAEIAHPDFEAGRGVELLPERAALLLADLERAARVGVVHEAGGRLLAARNSSG